jgi:hypothetical protein
VQTFILEAFAKVSMKSRLWCWMRKIKYKNIKGMMNFDENGD